MGGGAASGSGAPTFRVPARHRRPVLPVLPVLPQPPAPARKLRTRGRGLRRSRCARWMPGCCGSERDAGDTEKHVGNRRGPERGDGCGKGFRETEERGTGEPQTRIWRPREGCASHAHTRAYTGPHPLHTATHARPAPPPRRFPPTKPSYNRPGGSRGASASRARVPEGRGRVIGSSGPLVANPLLPPGHGAQP